MKKNLIALLLAVVMTAGSVGTVPAYAAETITEENAAEGATEPTAEETEEESTEDTDLNTDESEDTELEVESDTEVKEETEQASVESTEEGTTVDSTTEETISTDSEEVAMEEEETEASFDTSEEMAEIVEPEAVAEEVIEADNEEDSDAAITNEVLITGSSTQKASASRTIEVTAGKYYWYTYATTYGNLSFNADSNSYCSFVYGGYSSNAGYYYYTLHFYPKAGGKNTIIEVYDNNTGKNIDLLIVHSSDQEGEAQSICRGKSIEVEFETIDEISEGNVMVASVGSDSTISYVLNSFTFESILLHGSSVPRTYLYKANITLNTSGTYTVYLMNNSTYTTLVKIPVTVAEHDYDSGAITSEATCQKKAVLTRTCKNCGDTINEETGGYAEHAWNDIYTIDKAATCTEQGEESIHCSVCGETQNGSQRAVAPEGHAYGSWEIVKYPTCTEFGIQKKKCKKCGKTVSQRIDSTGHVWEEDYTIDNEATCTEEGTESIHCHICGEINESTIREIPKIKHTYGKWEVIKEATCTGNGNREKVCADCGDIVTELIPATGHIWKKEYSIDKEATCAEEGSESIHCSVCGEIDEATVHVITKKEHTYSNWEITQEATCTEDGIKEKVCAYCGDTITEEIPATGHIWSEEYTTDKEATCIEEGSESIHCAVCGEIDEESVRTIEKKEHTYGDWTVTKEATCTEDGSKEKVCADCGDKVTENIPATGHTWNEEYTVDKEATCAEEGSESIHCSVCEAIDETTVREIPCEEHDFRDWNTVKEPTCTEDGLQEAYCYYYGIYPGHSDIKDTEVIPATGHIWDEDYTVDKEATCAEEGSESIHCSVCGEIDANTVRSIPVKHTWEKRRSVDKEPTFEEDGIDSIHCSLCGAVKEGSERTINKLPKPISMLTISGITAKTYNGKAQTQNVIVKDGAKTLVNGTDYTVSYKNNTNVGTATVTITCVGNYVNSVDKTFAIRKASNTITAKSIVKSYAAQAQSFDLGVKVKSGTPTYKSDNKSVTVTKTGKVTVKAKFIGNANITITSPANKNFASVTKKIVVKVMPTKTKFTSVANSASKKMTLKWVKRTNATGYVIQYSTSSAFASAKTVRVDKNTTVSTTIGNLVKGKKYYVRIKTYRTVSGVKYYSGWSAVETVTIKK